MEPHEKATNPNKKQIMLNNFLGGIAWSIGTLVGLAIIFVVVGFFLKRVDIVPILGDFLSDIMKSSIQQTQNKLTF